MPETSIPAEESSHDVREFEFHISPASNSSRPHTGVGADGTSSRIRSAVADPSLTRIVATAAAASGMTPPIHRRFSYRKTRMRPAHLVPTAPSPTTPRRSPWWSGIGAISMTNRPAGTVTSRAEW